MRVRRGRASRAGFGALVVSSLVTGCPNAGSPGDDVTSSGSVAGLPVSRASYFADWEWGTAVADPEGGWRVVTDLGYEVHVARGWLVSYAASLVECPHEHDDATLATFLFGTPSARAGHAGAIDPSTTPTSTVESLAAADEVSLGEVSFDLAFYCSAHWVAGPLAAGGEALRIEGSWRAPGADEVVPFAWSSDIANGVLVDFADAMAIERADLQVFGVEVRVVRELDGWLDGIDYASTAPDAVGDMLMLGLAERTTIAIEQLPER